MTTPLPDRQVKESALPSAAFQPYPYNQWYVAAGRTELNDSLLSRYLLGKRVLLYRKSTGEPVAMSGWCPHRGFALSEGRRVGDEVQCMYHGFVFNGEGKCTHIPSQERVPSAMRVRSYPLVERGLFAWIWMGDPALADPAKIPDLSHYERSGYDENFFFCYTLQGNFQLVLDNLLDGTHASFVHSGLLDVDEAPDMPASDIEMTTDLNYIAWRRLMKGHRPDAAGAKWMGVPAGMTVDRLLTGEHFLPGMNVFVNRQTDPETGNFVSEQINWFPATPAQPGYSHQFVGWSTSYPSGDGWGYEAEWNIVAQDEPVLRWCQLAAEEQGPGAEISVKSDYPGILARRMMAAMVADEPDR